MAETMRYAIITPYYKEERRLIERCIDSVRNQTLRADHFLVADGFPQDWIDTAGVRHFKLDRSHGDAGNTPRGVGALIAIAEKYSGIGLLDVDNWLEPDHVEACVAAASTTPTPCDYVVAQRTFLRIDGSVMPIRDDGLHVDTNCFFFLRGAFCVVPHWAMMPKELSVVGDRVFYSMLRERDFVVARVPKPTVNYRTVWASYYCFVGETPPSGAKTIIPGESTVWLRSLSQRDNEIVGRLIGSRSPRYWLHLAQVYHDVGCTAEAAQAYARRAEMGGCDEEAWNARLQEARCLRMLGDEGGFVRQALAAFNMRPQRAEPLYDLARYYREKGMHDASVLFSEEGLAIARPEQDMLFLEDFVYTAGLQEEYSIAAFYARDPARKDRGFAACNWLALNRSIPEGNRALARSNLFFYVEPAGAMLPSFAARRVGFDPPAGYHPLNPSVTRLDQQIVVMLETVNYEIIEDGPHHQTPDNAPQHTLNFLLRLSDDLDIQSGAEILPPADMPEPAYKLVRGFQDLRLFTWRGELWGSARLRELTAEGWCEQVLARIDELGPATCRLTDCRVLRREGPGEHEKNWMPQVAGDRLQFIYLCDPTRVVDDRGSTVSETTPAIAATQFRGGSQLIAFGGGWLALIHEVQWRSSEKLPFYQHRFVWFDETNKLCGVSRPFLFHKRGVELAAGLAWHPDGERLLISYGVPEREAWIAAVSAGEVRGVLEEAEQPPSAWPRERGGLHGVNRIEKKDDQSGADAIAELQCCARV